MTLLSSLLGDARQSDVRLEARDLSMGYAQTRIIDDLDLMIPSGQVSAIVGPNGCGKSTLLAGLARLHKPISGSVLLDGKAIGSLPSREVARRLALLPQDASAPDGLTVSELIRFGRQPHQSLLRQWSEEDQAIVDAALVAADLLELADRPLESMSGGQRQRLAIARAVLKDAPILIQVVQQKSVSADKTALDNQVPIPLKPIKFETIANIPGGVN